MYDVRGMDEYMHYLLTRSCIFAMLNPLTAFDFRQSIRKCEEDRATSHRKERSNTH